MLPTPGDSFVDVPEKPAKGESMNEQDYGMLKIHAHNGAQRQADGAAAYAENLRYDYLEGKHVTDFGESLGARHITGPHPQFGSPDGKA